MFSNLGSLFNGGQYTFPFQFLLPQGLPSSFEYITNDVNCSIAYYGELRITRGDGSSVTQYKSFFVRQAVNSLNYSQEKISTGNISDWCSSKGNATFKSGVQDSSYTWGNIAKCYLDIDNSQCQLPVKSVKASLIQKLNVS